MAVRRPIFCRGPLDVFGGLKSAAAAQPTNRANKITRIRLFSDADGKRWMKSVSDLSLGILLSCAALQNAIPSILF